MLRYNLRKWQAMFLFAVAHAASMNVQAQGISLRIETETGRTQFRMGEAIGVKLTFETSETSSQDDWMVTITGRVPCSLWHGMAFWHHLRPGRAIH
jgi:hypothetical protein